MSQENNEEARGELDLIQSYLPALSKDQLAELKTIVDKQLNGNIAFSKVYTQNQTSQIGKKQRKRDAGFRQEVREKKQHYFANQNYAWNVRDDVVSLCNIILKLTEFVEEIPAPETVEGRLWQIYRLFSFGPDEDLVCIDDNTILNSRSDTDEHDTYMTSSCPKCHRSWSISHDSDERWMELVRHNVIYYQLTSDKVNDPLGMVEAFHRYINAKVGETPGLLPENLYKIRFDCMREENGEYLEACEKGDLIEVLDALIDMQYFLFGTILFHGLQDVFWSAFKEVHRSNMSKQPNGNKKAIKGVFYSPPDLKSILEEVSDS